MRSEYKPFDYKLSEYRPPKICLTTSISPGFVFGILRCFYCHKIYNERKMIDDIDVDLLHILK